MKINYFLHTFLSLNILLLIILAAAENISQSKKIHWQSNNTEMVINNELTEVDTKNRTCYCLIPDQC